MTTTSKHTLINGTRILSTKEWKALRSAMLTEKQRHTLSELKTEKEEAERAGDMKAAQSIINRENRMLRYIRACDFLLYTGMRGVEAAAFKPVWYRPESHAIVIPESEYNRSHGKYVQRTILLSKPGCAAVEAFIKAGTGIPERQTFWRSLNRYASRPTDAFPSGVGTDGITPKMFRNTLAAWLMACYPEKEMYISASMGYSREVLQKQYLGLGFEREEVVEMRENYLLGWGMRL